MCALALATSYGTARRRSGDPDGAELDRYPLLRPLRPPDRRRLLGLARAVRLPAQATLLREGEQSRELYLVRRGRVGVFREQGGVEHELATFGPGEAVGEMAFLDGAARSASVRTLAESELLVLDGDALDADPAHHDLLHVLAGGIARSTVERLREATDAQVTALERQLEASRLQTRFGEFFGYVTAIYAAATIFNAVVASDLVEIDVFSQAFGWLYVLVLLVPALFGMWVMRIPLREVGVTLRGWRRSVGEGVGASVAVGVALLGGLWVLREAGVVPPGEPRPILASTAAVYLVHSYLQEFLARGLFQSTCQKLFADRRGLRSVVIASTLFALFHVHFGLMAVALVGVSGIFLGVFYLRHHSILGVTILHWALGLIALQSGLL